MQPRFGSRGLCPAVLPWQASWAVAGVSADYTGSSYCLRLDHGENLHNPNVAHGLDPRLATASVRGQGARWGRCPAVAFVSSSTVFCTSTTLFRPVSGLVFCRGCLTRRALSLVDCGLVWHSPEIAPFHSDALFHQGTVRCKLRKAGPCGDAVRFAESSWHLTAASLPATKRRLLCVSAATTNRLCAAQTDDCKDLWTRWKETCIRPARFSLSAAGQDLCVAFIARPTSPDDL